MLSVSSCQGRPVHRHPKKFISIITDATHYLLQTRPVGNCPCQGAIATAADRWWKPCLLQAVCSAAATADLCTRTHNKALDDRWDVKIDATDRCFEHVHCQVTSKTINSWYWRSTRRETNLVKQKKNKNLIHAAHTMWQQSKHTSVTGYSSDKIDSNKRFRESTNAFECSWHHQPHTDQNHNNPQVRHTVRIDHLPSQASHTGVYGSVSTV